MGVQVIKQLESGEGVRELGFVGEKGYFSFSDAPIEVRVIRGEFPAPIQIPPVVQKRNHCFDPAMLLQKEGGGGVHLRNVRSAATRFLKAQTKAKDEKETQSDEEEEEEEQTNEKDEACDRSNEEKAKEFIPPETKFRMLSPSTDWPLPENSFVVVKGRGKGESRPWQLSVFVDMTEEEPEDDAKNSFIIRFWGCENINLSILTSVYQPAWLVKKGRQWVDCYQKVSGSQPSSATADRDEVICAYAVDKEVIERGKHVIPLAVQAKIKEATAAMKSRRSKRKRSEKK
jgi:hypothetical protein